jgi:hypothetical protein
MTILESVYKELLLFSTTDTKHAQNSSQNLSINQGALATLDVICLAFQPGS